MKFLAFLIVSLTLVGCASKPPIVIEKQSYPLTPCLVSDHQIVTNADLANAYLIAKSELNECARQTEIAIEYNNK